MKWIPKLLLFMNAFLLMNILFIGKEIYIYLTGETYKNLFILIGIILIGISIAGGLFGFIFICSKPKNNCTQCKAYHKENVTGNYYFGYFSLFVLLFLSFDFHNVLNLIIFIVLFFALAFVYCRNDLFYINPTIFLLGKRIYKLHIERKGHTEIILALSNKPIELGVTYRFYFSPYEFTICEKIKSD